jgi:hypothetical protein
MTTTTSSFVTFPHCGPPKIPFMAHSAPPFLHSEGRAACETETRRL